MKVGLFFGAGAEISYGLPSGGKFAIDLFRKDPTPYKKSFRAKLLKINSRSPYANTWLPKGYEKKSIFAFGKNEFTSIIESSIQYKRNEIIKKLNDFDNEFTWACSQLEIEEGLVKDKFSNEMGKDIGETLYDQDIKINEKLTNDVKLFGTEYYSAALEIIRSKSNCADLHRYVIAFLQLLVGAYGQDFVQNLNEELFESAPDDLPIFDDIFGMFRLEFDRVGSTALDLLLSEKRTFNTTEEATLIDLFSAVTQQILENIFCSVLDYQKLIDDHFRYLFSPSTEWAKFTRMAIFMEIAHDYIIAQKPTDLPDYGYYHDVKGLIDSGQEVGVVGTSNYNNLFKEISNDLNLPPINVFHLNGSTEDFYNPYKNEVMQIEDKDLHESEQILVPFMLTQSGLKPLTSVEMSRRYVELFDAYKDMDAIISIGFGFNKDDSHINGLFRELIEKSDKKLFVITVDTNETDKEVRKKLRLDTHLANVKVILVDPKTRAANEVMWFEEVSKQIG
ncbi:MULTISPECIES: hypothetical protein [Acinetobacter]|jgi:hypothetical protein|uniref:hypothetical protein n=1 Tax=Acinetobacter TaxID=469 RepID=UPI00029E7C8B|nr:MULTISPECIES: hypothetical protein [Acinetobacter]KRJ24238.1 hypothetical protein APC81_02090 [Acinetobacter baumannii]EKU67447.1 hypothetical protein ACINWC136_3214 [Acinetobacter pittii]EXA91195.1 hypothetical protein J508_0610 [Acinetobacter sp. 1289694]EXH75444.1 hypothetical protein J633_2641 [Acinetobacter sp. 216872]KAI0678073.1 hypothetical protein A6010_18295 [Acinetobacter pittii]